MCIIFEFLNENLVKEKMRYFAIANLRIIFYLLINIESYV